MLPRDENVSSWRKCKEFHYKSATNFSVAALAIVLADCFAVGNSWTFFAAFMHMHLLFPLFLLCVVKSLLAVFFATQYVQLEKLKKKPLHVTHHCLNPAQSIRNAHHTTPANSGMASEFSKQRVKLDFVPSISLGSCAACFIFMVEQPTTDGSVLTFFYFCVWIAILCTFASVICFCRHRMALPICIPGFPSRSIVAAFQKVVLKRRRAILKITRKTEPGEIEVVEEEEEEVQEEEEEEEEEQVEEHVEEENKDEPDQGHDEQAAAKPVEDRVFDEEEKIAAEAEAAKEVAKIKELSAETKATAAAAAAVAEDLQIEDLMQRAAPKVTHIDIAASIISWMPRSVATFLVELGNLRADLLWLSGTKIAVLVGIIFAFSGGAGCLFREFAEERGSCGLQETTTLIVVCISTFEGLVYVILVAQFLSSTRDSRHAILQTKLEKTMMAMKISNPTDLLRWHACRVQWQHLLLELWEAFRHQVAWLTLLLFAGQASLTWLMFEFDDFLTGSWLWGCVHTALLGFLVLKLTGGFTHSLESTMPMLNTPLKSALVGTNFGHCAGIHSCTRSTPCGYCRPKTELKNQPDSALADRPTSSGPATCTGDETIEGDIIEDHVPAVFASGSAGFVRVRGRWFDPSLGIVAAKSPLPADPEQLKTMLLEERSEHAALEHACNAMAAELSNLKTELEQKTTAKESNVAIVKVSMETETETETAASEHKAALQWTLQHWDSKDNRPCFRVLGPMEVTSKSITRLTRFFTVFAAYIAVNTALVLGVSLSADHGAILQMLERVPYIGSVLKYAFPSLTGVIASAS
jgi:hypothetical protein